MGRKIPAKKHRGVKDPVKQQEQRFQSIKNKINAPPTDPDEQPVPRSLQRLFGLQEPRTAASKVQKKKSRSHTDKKQGNNPVASLKRMPGESGRAFSLRINSAVRVLHNTDQEDYPSDMDETDERGDYIASKRLHRQRKHRQALAKEGKGGAGAAGDGERLSKAQRRALKRKEQQKAKEVETSTTRELDARELRYERVAFGDIAHAPPALTAPRRAPAAAGAARPGRRDLLLASMLKPGNTTTQQTNSKSKSKITPAANAADQLRRERARLEAVDAYRALKKQRAADKEKTR